MQDIINKYVADEFGHITIPKTEEEKLALVRALLGFSLISNLDNWLSDAFDLIDNSEPAEPFVRENETSRKDKALRTAFAGLDNEVKEKIKQLVIDTGTEVLFSSLVSLDQFDFGEISFKVRPKTLDESNEVLEISKKWQDLHDELPEWIENFSKFKEKLKN